MLLLARNYLLRINDLTALQKQIKPSCRDAKLARAKCQGKNDDTGNWHGEEHKVIVMEELQRYSCAIEFHHDRPSVPLDSLLASLSILRPTCNSASQDFSMQYPPSLITNSCLFQKNMHSWMGFSQISGVQISYESGLQWVRKEWKGCWRAIIFSFMCTAFERVRIGSELGIL